MNKHDQNDEVIFYIDDKPIKTNRKNKKVFFKCDRRKCDKCTDFINVDCCQYTTDIRHAENFELQGDVFVEK